MTVEKTEKIHTAQQFSAEADFGPQSKNVTCPQTFSVLTSRETVTREYRSEILPNILECTQQPSKQNYLPHNVKGAKAEKPCLKKITKGFEMAY